MKMFSFILSAYFHTFCWFNGVRYSFGRFALYITFAILLTSKKTYKTATIDKRIDKMCTQLYTGMNDTNFLSLSFPSFAFAATF